MNQSELILAITYEVIIMKVKFTMYVIFTNPYNLYFKQKLEKLDPRISKHVPRQHDKVFSTLSVLARDISELAFNEKATFSPILKRWHPLAAGVAVATLHVCYGHEVKQYVKSVTELTPDAVEMLMAADKLERTGTDSGGRFS